MGKNLYERRFKEQTAALNETTARSTAGNQNPNYRPDILTPYNDPERNLAEIAFAEETERQEIYRPVNQQMIGTVGSTDLVTAAQEDSAMNLERNKERMRRQRMRYGIHADKLERMAQGRRFDISEVTAEVDNVNNARLDQYERNTRIRDELINTGRGINTSAVTNLASGAQASNAVDNANKAAKASEQAGYIQAGTSLITAGIMYAALSS